MLFYHVYLAHLLISMIITKERTGVTSKKAALFTV